MSEQIEFRLHHDSTLTLKLKDLQSGCKYFFAGPPHEPHLIHANTQEEERCVLAYYYDPEEEGWPIVRIFLEHHVSLHSKL